MADVEAFVEMYAASRDQAELQKERYRTAMFVRAEDERLLRCCDRRDRKFGEGISSG